MKNVQTRPPSFPQAPLHQPLAWEKQTQWQVLCGDTHHWRMGMYSPKETSRAELHNLERHDCPELFVLLHGSLTLVIAESSGLREIVLEPHVPVLVAAPHAGYCPRGPYSGVALVVERDSFDTEYRPARSWIES
ncbi:MAG TPA: hypothetical protein PLJ27_17705 [Polyangiaceae bacterium]|jgi:hypothetical protein|nr:MAG: hypothetical protein BWY17_00522 [Deltaproteobacteria bacterium ADurb.Bin207]HNS99597.1 hypothetical protein [Polyangiaceae bacterium]HNZ20854.1 hypothetical protein [Polyangiaceae bacterium]HOD21427.1 hypothetical protein [Polyangiaceae bacterium]HOE47536.1 hypothetical protein [Polyangiaceae bacterium]